MLVLHVSVWCVRQHSIARIRTHHCLCVCLDIAYSSFSSSDTLTSTHTHHIPNTHCCQYFYMLCAPEIVQATPSPLRWLLHQRRALTFVAHILRLQTPSTFTNLSSASPLALCKYVWDKSASISCKSSHPSPSVNLCTLCISMFLVVAHSFRLLSGAHTRTLLKPFLSFPPTLLPCLPSSLSPSIPSPSLPPYPSLPSSFPDWLPPSLPHWLSLPLRFGTEGGSLHDWQAYIRHQWKDHARSLSLTHTHTHENTHTLTPSRV